MLGRASSLELSEWQAYEAFSGPLGVQYEREILRSIDLTLKQILFQYVSSKTTANKAKAFEVVAFPTPPEFMQPVGQEEEDPKE